MAITLFKVSDFSINRKPVCHVLLANNDKILRPIHTKRVYVCLHA